MNSVKKAILRKVSELSGVSMPDICGESRKRPVSRVRQFVSYCLMEVAGLSSTAAAHYLDCHHTSVLHGRKCVMEAMLRGDANYLRWLPIVEEAARKASVEVANSRVDQVEQITKRISEVESTLLSLYRRRELLIDFTRLTEAA